MDSSAPVPGEVGGTAEKPLAAVELPEINDGPHFFYGLQWWFFGLLAIGGFVYLVYDEWRQRRTRDRKSVV